MLIAGVVVGCRSLFALLRLSIGEDSYSYVFVVLAVSLYLIYSERKSIFSTVSYCPSSAAMMVPALIAMGLLEQFQLTGLPPRADLALAVLASIIFVVSAFVLFFGKAAFRGARFPLLFLVLMIPIPPGALARIVGWLQAGSTDGTYLFFQLLHIPVFRQGSTLSLPNLTMEIASECSSIRSSTVMVLTAILSAHLFLRAPWAKGVLAIAALPIAVIKNVIRISTLSMLALYVDPEVLQSPLHRDGGMIFFLIGLAVLGLLLHALRSLEGRSRAGT